MSEALSACGVSRKYGSQSVLNGLNLNIERGGFEALMGPSGCGKSTFIHLAAGLIKCDAGDIRIGNRSITSMNDNAAACFRRRHVGVVFQAFNLLNEKTVFQNIVMPLALDGANVRAAEIVSRVNELSERLGIAAILNKRPEALSGGEQQRVAIARALVAKPEVVLADEPTGNLDANTSKDICQLFKVLNETEQSAFLMVTHDPQVAAVARRVHFLKEGTIAASYDTEGNAERVSKLYLETYR